MHVTMLAAEYGGAAALCCTPLANAVHELACALAADGHHVNVITPGYGVVEGTSSGALSVEFAGTSHQVEVISAHACGAVRHIALEHPRFTPQGDGKVYCHDGPDAPYATDASKFAFFSAACASWLSAATELPDVIHIHDWPAALFFALREYDPAHLALRTVRCVFSLHSDEVQGRRPLAFHESSLRSWFLDLPLPRRAVVDPDYDDCVNPVATAMRLADMVALPSAAYVEVLCADEDANLAPLARHLKSRNQLVGIDAGAKPREHAKRRPAWSKTRAALTSHLRSLIGREPHLRSAHFLCDRTLATLPTRRPAVVASLAGPFDANAIVLLAQKHPQAPSVLDALLDTLDGHEYLVAQGDGVPEAEAFLTAVAARHTRFVYLQGADGNADQHLLHATDFHLVLPRKSPGAAPALAALNAGRPCLVHATGGLCDAVEDGINGWHTDILPHSIASAFARACNAKRSGGTTYANLCRRAAASGTPWQDVAQLYLDQLYRVTVT